MPAPPGGFESRILQEGRVTIVDTTVIEAVQSGISKSDPDAGSHVKVNAKVEM